MMIDDPTLPAATTLMGDGAAALLDTAVRAGDGDLLDLRTDQVLYRPGERMTVRWSATVSWSGAPATTETLVAITDVDGPPAGALHLEADGMTVGVWRYPHDPALPGLEAAVVPARVRALLGDRLPGPIELDVRVYRPGRRAVVEVVTPTGRAFLKVVRPTTAAALAERHRRLADTLPVPEVLDADVPAGILVLSAIDGEGLRDRLARGRGRLPRAAQLLDLLDRLDRADVPAGPARRSPLAVAHTHVALLERVVPDQRDRLHALAEALGDVTPQPVATVHGDLHEAQLIVGRDGAVTGLLDVDGAGTGARVDDLATLLGHLSTLARTCADQRARIHAYASSLARRFATTAEPAELDRRAAAAVLGLATGPFRVQLADWPAETRRRIHLAQQWLDGRARRRAA